MSDYIDRMADEFMYWKLPADFMPDCGISFQRDPVFRNSPHWPTGTNLFTTEQARAMFKHCADDLLEDLARKDADLHSQGRTLIDAWAECNKLRSALAALMESYVEGIHGSGVCDCEPPHHDLCAPCQARAALAKEEQ